MHAFGLALQESVAVCDVLRDQLLALLLPAGHSGFKSLLVLGRASRRAATSSSASSARSPRPTSPPVRPSSLPLPRLRLVECAQPASRPPSPHSQKRGRPGVGLLLRQTQELLFETTLDLFGSSELRPEILSLLGREVVEGRLSSSSGSPTPLGTAGDRRGVRSLHPGSDAAGLSCRGRRPKQCEAAD